jgi:YkoY family integral membrane protein
MNSLAAFFQQTFQFSDLAIIGLLIVLEGVLSIDNALVLGLLAKRLPKHLQPRALTYGLVGAFVFRLIAIALASVLLEWWVVKLLGGAYLIYVAVKHFFFEDKHDVHAADPVVGSALASGAATHTTRTTTTPEQDRAAIEARTPLPVPDNAAPRDATRYAKFWPTVFVIEMTDIAFAIDSILAAIALVAGVPHDPHRPHPKLWVVITGGFLGVVLMRFAAVVFIRLLDRFPRFETAAYLLVTIIGLKLVVDWGFNKPPPDHPPGAVYHGPADFHSFHSPAFWVFWVLMIACFAVGFIPKRVAAEHQPQPTA